MRIFAIDLNSKRVIIKLLEKLCRCVENGHIGRRTYVHFSLCLRDLSNTILFERGCDITGNLAEELMAELECETVFTIPILGGIEVKESTVVTWIIMAVVTLLCVIFVRNLSVENPSKKQLVLEIIVGKLHDFFYDLVGEHGKRYIPYLMTVIIYLGFSNIIGYFGMKPPTKDMNVTLGLSIMSIILIQYASIHKKGTKGWIKSFAKPIPIILPINILELVIKPLSLCMRLFGNVLGAFVIMELIKIIVPLVVPIPFSLYFDLFDGLIQAYVFVFLTSLFIEEAVEDED